MSYDRRFLGYLGVSSVISVWREEPGERTGQLRGSDRAALLALEVEEEAMSQGVWVLPLNLQNGSQPSTTVALAQRGLDSDLQNSYTVHLGGEPLNLGGSVVPP